MQNSIGYAPSYKLYNKIIDSIDFEKAFKCIENPTIDLQSIYEICNYGYILGNGTILNELKRETIVNPIDILNDIKIIKTNEDIAKNFYDILCLEIEEYIALNKRIGILLSGGLDSRILAGVLKTVQNRSGNDIEVVAFSWGIENSRDIIYAKEICARYNWRFQPIYQNEEILIENIKLGQNLGSESNPLNFHSMNYINNNNDVDIFLAGSYGDSLGRAEYNGKRIEKAPTMAEKSHDFLHIFNNDFETKCKNNIINDNKLYYEENDILTDKNYLLKEVDYLIHHHTKYLSISMSLISKEKPLFQLFTHKRTLKYLFGLDLSYRYDNLYKDLLLILPENIGHIPWARTGKSFINRESESDNYLPNHHLYPEWFYKKRNEIIQMIDLEKIDSMGIFNINILYKMLYDCRNTKYSSVNKQIRIIVWLASFSYMLNNHKNIKIGNFKSTTSKKNKLNYISYPIKIKLVEQAKIIRRIL